MIIIVIPSKEEIQEIEERIRKKLNEPESFEFTGDINVEVLPYQFSDMSYIIDVGKEPFSLTMVLYSVKFPDSYYRWEKYAIQDIRQKIVINQQKNLIKKLKKKGDKNRKNS